MYRLKFFIVCLLVVAMLSHSTYGANQISQFGITWTFDRDYSVGQFANGDYWVVGPVTIISINPASADIGGRIVHGSMINPLPSQQTDPRSGTGNQGFDGDVHANLSYVESLNMARKNGSPLSSTNSRTIDSNSSLLSVISYIPRGSQKPCFTDAAVLTVLPSAPEANSFRPAYSGSDKTIPFSTDDINSATYSLFADLTATSGAPSMSTVEGYFNRVWIDHWGSDPGESYMCASNNQEHYGREISTQVGTGALMLNCDFTDSQKRSLLIHMVQRGIDAYGVLTNTGGGDAWDGRGGHNSGRYFLILLAGYVMGNEDMIDVGDNIVPNGGSYHFGEIDQTFYVEETSPGFYNYQDIYGDSGYIAGDVGLPEWGVRHWAWRIDTDDAKSWWGNSYRTCCTANSWAGFILASHIMGIKDLWRHNAIFDYQDRFMDVQAQEVGVGNWQRQTSVFLEQMWDTYRANYGCVWTRYDPTDIYSNGTCDSGSSNPVEFILTTTAENGSISRNPDLPVYPSGSSVVLQAVPNTGYTFTTWSGSLSGSTNPTTITMDSNKNITANFTAIASNTYYVDKNHPAASDSNPGTESLPWLTIQHAANTVQAGDTTLIKGGTYSETITPTNSGGPAALITFKSYPSQTAVINGKFNLRDKSYIRLDALEMVGPSPSTSGEGVLAANSEGVIVKNCTISNWANGIHGWVARDITIRNCHLFNLGEDGIKFSNWQDGLIENNTIFHLLNYVGHSDGMDLRKVDNIIVRRNLVYDIVGNSAFQISPADDAFPNLYYGGKNIILENNIFYGVTNFVVYILDSENVKIFNNVIWGGLWGGLQLGSFGTHPPGHPYRIGVVNAQIYNNILESIDFYVGVGSQGLDSSYVDPSYYQGNNNIMGYIGWPGDWQAHSDDLVGVDPEFVGISGTVIYGNMGPINSSPTAENFQIKETSPAKNAGGHTHGEPIEDFWSNPRVGTYDIGVHEYQSSDPNSQPDPNTSPVALVSYWKFDDGNDPAADSSSSGNTGTLVNGPVWDANAGRIDGGVRFDGSDDAVEVPTAGWNTNKGTVALWAKGEDFSGMRYLFGHTLGTWSNRIQLYVNEGNLGLGLGDSHTRHTNIQTLNVNTWYHIALTWDEPSYVVYINGIDDANGTYAGLTALSTLADIGNNGNTSDRSEAFNGIIDEVRVYNRALTAGEVLDLFNEAPVLMFGDIGDKVVDEGSTLTFEVNTVDPNVVVDINDHSLPSDPCFFYNGGSWNFSWGAEDGDDGTYEVTFIATNGEIEDFETITITVNDVDPNSPPVADAGPDQNVPDTDRNDSEQVTLDGSASTDPDGDISTYVWTEDGNQIATGANPPPVTLSVGVHTIVLTVTDLGGLEDADDVIITVKKENSPPNLEAIPDKWVSENSLLSFSISATDPDGDAITYSAQNLPTGATFSGNTFTWTPTSGQAGSYDVTFIASDGDLEDTETITITVAPAGSGSIADGETSSGTVSGSYTDTYVSDDIYESIKETIRGISEDRSGFVHKWTIDVTGGDTVTFYVEAHHTANTEGDDFTFAYSTDDSAYTNMLTVTKTVDDNTYQSYQLPSNISGTLYIRVLDTNRVIGNTVLDTIYIDHMYIRSEDGSTTWTLTVGSSSGGSVTKPGEGDFDYNPGEVVPIEANADISYYFVEWTGDISQIADPFAANTTITMDADYTIQANFAILPAGVDNVANGETSSGTVSGSYTDTYVSDDIYESIEETIRGINEDRSGFVHKWTIDVTGGDTVTFYVEAHHTANTEGDDFTFAYSTDGSAYTNMLTVTKTVDDNTYQSYQLPSNISGTLYIRVLDTNRVIDNIALDTIYIDHMYIRSGSGG